MIVHISAFQRLLHVKPLRQGQSPRPMETVSTWATGGVPRIICPADLSPCGSEERKGQGWFKSHWLMTDKICANCSLIMFDIQEFKVPSQIHWWYYNDLISGVSRNAVLGFIGFMLRGRLLWWKFSWADDWRLSIDASGWLLLRMQLA